MKPVTLIEVIDAAHCTAYVESPFEQRGGLMLIGPPETLRTTMIDIALGQHPSALIVSDINMRSLTGLKDDLTSGRYSTIGFSDYQKLYERAASTAANVEGTLRALMEEGFSKSPHDDPTSASTRARALLVAAMVEATYKNKVQDWKQSGYLRRWLVCLLYMPVMSRNKLTQSVHDWKKLEFDGIKRVSPTTPIPYNISEEESRRLLLMVKEQASQGTPFVLLKKIYCVLKWKYKDQPGKVADIMSDFAPTLGKDGVGIVI
jgi:hypothetical protein